MSHKCEPDSIEACGGPVEEESFDQEEVVVFETSLVPIVEVEMAQLPPSPDPCCRALDETLEEEGSYPEVSDRSGMIVGSSSASYFRSDGPQVIRCFQVASSPPQGDAHSVSAWPLCDFEAAALAHSFAAQLQIKTCESAAIASQAGVIFAHI